MVEHSSRERRFLTPEAAHFSMKWGTSLGIVLDLMCLKVLYNHIFTLPFCSAKKNVSCVSRN